MLRQRLENLNCSRWMVAIRIESTQSTHERGCEPQDSAPTSRARHPGCFSSGLGALRLRHSASRSARLSWLRLSVRTSVTVSSVTPLPAPRCCPGCSARLLPEETVCNKCAINTHLPTHRPCPWCGDSVPRGMVICRHCHVDLTVPVAEPTHCGICGAVMNSAALACVRCGSPVSVSVTHDLDQTQPLDHVAPRAPCTPHPPAHQEFDFATRVAADAGATPNRRRSPLSRGRLLATAVLVAIGLGLQVWAAAWLVRQNWLPVPQDWLDTRNTAWVVAHAACFVAAMFVAAVAACVVPASMRPTVSSPGAVALAAGAPSLALAWSVAQLLVGGCVRVAALFVPSEVPPAAVAPPDPLLSPPRRHSTAWTWVAAGECLLALLLCAAVIWPAPWRPFLPVPLAGAVDWLQASGLWLRWLLAAIGLAHVLAAAFGWYWESFDEGAVVTWLSPVVLLAPLLVFLSTALLTGLGRDVGGPESISLSHALRDSAVLWSLLSLYGLYYLITSWAAVRSFVVTAVIGYVLLGPLFLVGWQTGRIEAHRLECGRRLMRTCRGPARLRRHPRRTPAAGQRRSGGATAAQLACPRTPAHRRKRSVRPLRPHRPVGRSAEPSLADRTTGTVHLRRTPLERCRLDTRLGGRGGPHVLPA